MCYCSAKDTEELFVASLLFLPRAVSPWLTGDNYALLSSYCQAQFATQINWAAFEERGGRGEGENEREQQREKAKDETITNQQTKQRNTATQSSEIILQSVMFFSVTYRSHLETFAERNKLLTAVGVH